MKYRFEIHESQDSTTKEVPSIILENQEEYGFFFLDEIMNLDIPYLEKIITSLNDVMAAKSEIYNFGHELYSIDCKSDVSTVIDAADGWKVVAEIPTTELIEFLKDWKNFKVKFNAQN